MKIVSFALLALVVLSTSGCVTGRRSIALETPTTVATSSNRGTVALASVVDQRVFQNKPSDPSTPSIDGDVNKANRDVLKTMIGRQRNGWGKAMGDIQLTGGDTVEAQMRHLVAEGFRRRGYSVSESQSGDHVARVAIDKFWAWFTPGFWAVDFEAQLSCELSIDTAGSARKVTVTGYGKNVGQVASDLNWQQAYERAFTDFLQKFDSALSGAGL